jgi:hypothetical protein
MSVATTRVELVLAGAVLILVGIAAGWSPAVIAVGGLTLVVGVGEGRIARRI